MQKMAKGGIIIITSLIGSWLGAALDHDNWWGAPSIILGVVGIGAGYYLAQVIDNYIEG